MDRTLMWQRVADARVGRLATLREDGRPHLVPCCFVLLGGGEAGGEVGGGTIYSAVDTKPKSTLALRRLANLRANGHASLLVDHYDDDWSQLWWVRVDGRGRVVEAERRALGGEGDPNDRGDWGEHERALAALSAKYEQYRRAAPPGPVVAVDVERWAAWP